MVVNAASVSTATRRSRGVLRRAVTLPLRALTGGRGADLLFVSEARDFAVHELVDPTVWQVVQFGPLGAPESGCAVIARRERVRIDDCRLELGAEPGGGIAARWFPVVEISVRYDNTWVPVGEAAAIHTPPARAPEGQRTYMSSITAADVGLLAGDFNLHRRDLRRWFPTRRIRAVEVLAVVCARHLGAGRARRRNVGSDHPAVIVPRWLAL
jgi:hypothetical protein